MTCLEITRFCAQAFCYEREIKFLCCFLIQVDLHSYYQQPNLVFHKGITPRLHLSPKYAHFLFFFKYGSENIFLDPVNAEVKAVYKLLGLKNTGLIQP